MNGSPIGPPYVYLLMCLAWAWAAFGIKDLATRRVTFLLTLSGAMYALGFFPIGIAHEYRYIFWTMLCATIATPVIVLRVLMRADAPLTLRLGPPLLILTVIAFREFMVRWVL
jgi:hypothetical protein